MRHRYSFVSLKSYFANRSTPIIGGLSPADHPDPIEKIDEMYEQRSISPVHQGHFHDSGISSESNETYQDDSGIIPSSSACDEGCRNISRTLSSFGLDEVREYDPKEYNSIAAPSPARWKRANDTEAYRVYLGCPDSWSKLKKQNGEEMNDYGLQEENLEEEGTNSITRT